MAGPADSLRALWSRLARKAEDTAGELFLDSYRDQVAAARDLIARGDPESAAEMMEALLADRPDHSGALTVLGAARLALGQPGAAAIAFERSLEERSGDPHALIGLGEARVGLGLLDEAIATLGKGIEQAGGDRDLLSAAYQSRGRAWRARGDLDKAIRELRKAVAEAPDEAMARAALGEALLADPRTSSAEARRHLERAAEADPAPPGALLALAGLALTDGQTHAAAPLYERARLTALAGHGVEARDQMVAALVGLGDVARAQRDHSGAHQRYLEALEIDPRRARVHARLAALHRDLGNPHAAVAAYERALALDGSPALLPDAIATAQLAGDRERAVRWANDLLAVEPGAPIALAARAAELIDRGQLDPAAALLTGAPPSVEIAIERSRIERLRDPGPPAAARAARAALTALDLAPDDPRARAALVEARADELAVPVDADIGVLAEATGRVVASRPDLAHLIADVARAAAELEQPLLVTVMGEFSSGKSSFVNAFIGADVAATGITPTTATINVVKYGHERGGRVIGRDGSVRELGWDQLHGHLRGFDAAGARAVDRVEILLPIDTLAKVHIVDTPGLNSILPEHEATARAFIARADAVVWVFTASQGGKASERKALDAIRAQGKRVLGVLNKRDQLSPAEVDEVVAHVTEQLADRVEVVIPFSARTALAAKLAAAEPAATDDGNWAALASALETRFFAQARQIKRAACARRLGAIVTEARAVVDRDRATVTERAAALSAQRDQLSAAAATFADDVVAPTRRALAGAVDDLYRRAAREVIDLVRPRQLPFGSHSATSADRDYLIALLDDGYEMMLLAAEAQVAGAIEAQLHGAPAEAVTAAVAAAVAPLTRAAAYVSGYLAGGAVESFFRSDLPRLSLEPDAVHHALFRSAPDLERIVAEPLARAGHVALTRAAADVALRAARTSVDGFDLDVGLGRALDDLATQLAD